MSDYREIFDAERGVPITAPKSHASLARAFLAEFCDDADMQAMVQFHDEPFALWRQSEAKGKFNQERLMWLWDSDPSEYAFAHWPLEASSA